MVISFKKIRGNIGNKIQRKRKKLGYSQEKLAELANISRTHMGHIEQGRKSPSLKVLTRLSQKLKIRLGELFP